MEFKGTKGGWEAKRLNIINYSYIASGDKFIANIAEGEETKANALLISKAPEMLEMLQKFVSMSPNGVIAIADLMDKAEQLIKEATEL
jgi:hypothetical protein